MVAIAHVLAITCYLGAAALAAAPFARPIPAPVRGVAALLGVGVLVHALGLIGLAVAFGRPPLTGIGPALSFAAVLIVSTLLVVEVAAREVSLTLFAAPFAALATTAATALGLDLAQDPRATDSVWLVSHIALSFAGVAGFTAAAGAGIMYLVARRELKSRRFGAIFRFFPPLETLDRVNHLAVIGGWLALTFGVALAVGYSIAHRYIDVAQTVWGLAAWIAVTGLTAGRVLGGLRAHRAALLSAISFVAVMALYLTIRVLLGPGSRQFL